MKKIIIVPVLLALIIMAGCNLKDVTGTSQYSMLLVHAAPSVGPVNFALQNNKVDSNISYGQQTLYLPGTKSPNNLLPTATVHLSSKPDSLLSDIFNVDFADNKKYSFFFYAANTGNVTNYNPGATYLLDSFSTPAPGHTAIRFVHLSPDAPAVDVLLNGVELTDNKLFYENDKNNYATGFLDKASGTYSLDIRQHGSTSILYNMPSITFGDGKVYTIYLKGVYHSAFPSLLVGTVTHN